MKSNIWSFLRTVSGISLAVLLATAAANAQTATAVAGSKSTAANTSEVKKDTKPSKSTPEPTSVTTGEDAGSFTVTSSIEFGYRGIRSGGDQEKLRSDLNLKAGPRVFDSSFFAKAKEGKKTFFESLLVTSTGWGADPYGNVRLSVENPKWYRFDGVYRRFKYYRFLNNIANPNWLFTGFPVPPNPKTGQHGYNTRTEFGDFELTILPKNRLIRFNVGYSPERYDGPFFTNYHLGGNEFQALVNARTRANDFRVGADGTVGPIDWTFLQGFRRFRDDSFVDVPASFINPNPAVARFTSFNRNEPTRGKVNFTRASMHTLVAGRLDITSRIVHSNATANSTFIENMTGTNFNSRITGQLGPPNTLLLGQYVIPSNAERPYTLFDLGVTLLATKQFRLSNTFRIEDFTIDGVASFSDIFRVQRNATIDTRTFTDLSAFKTTKYRKYQDTIEGDYQITKNYSVHFGYRYGHRREEQTISGFNLGSNAPTALTPEEELETNRTNAFFGGFKARPTKDWTVYFDAEHGTADNLFTRIGNYDYDNIRFKSRYRPTRNLSFNLAVIGRNNASPSEIAGISLADFGVTVKSRTFQSSVDWAPTSNLAISTGYNYNWVNSNAIIDYYYQVPPATSVFHHFGNALYYQRNNYFFFDATSRLTRRVTLYTAYRINQDNGQGNRLPQPTAGTPIAGGVVVEGSLRNPAVLGGTLINSYPMSFQSPEARLAIRIHRRLDWNLGYQYYSYNEDKIVNIFPASPRPQNYHAHLPYMSLRVYFGRPE